MKTPLIPIIFLLTASAVPLLATPDTDHQAMDAAMKTYVIRVLENHVTVKVVDGVASLTGTAETLEDKEMAGDAVSNVPGITRVENQIVVASTDSEHSDAWIAAKIRLTLVVRAPISLDNILVAVKDGTVTLNGTVKSMAAKTLVESCAKNVEGVKDVKDQIGVDAPVNDSKIVVETVDDASIIAEVKYALYTDRATRALKLNITTSNGVVVITGEAASDADKAMVTQLAGSVRGVVSVTNNMTVKT